MARPSQAHEFLRQTHEIQWHAFRHSLNKSRSAVVDSKQRLGLIAGQALSDSGAPIDTHRIRETARPT
jgi:hypothetical protein